MKPLTSYPYAGAILLLLTLMACNQNGTEAVETTAATPTQTAAAKPNPPSPKPKPPETQPVAQETTPEKPVLDPNHYDPDEPVPASALYDAFYGDKDAWLGKQVTVVGYYKGSTHSSATDETRVDLKTGQLGKTVVGCMIKGKDVTPRSAVAQRAGVIMRGTISEPFFGQVILRNAVFMNRE